MDKRKWATFVLRRTLSSFKECKITLILINFKHNSLLDAIVWNKTNEENNTEDIFPIKFIVTLRPDVTDVDCDVTWAAFASKEVQKSTQSGNFLTRLN